MAAYKPKFLERGKRHLKIRPVGEVFVMNLRTIGYMYGRIIRNDCPWEAPTSPRPWKRVPGYYVVYIFSQVTQEISKDIDLGVKNLLLAPHIIGDGGWKLGYFQPLFTKTIATGELLNTHCFNAELLSGPVYITEYGDILEHQTEPNTDFGYGEYGFIERCCCEALGVPYPD